MQFYEYYFSQKAALLYFANLLSLFRHTIHVR